MEKITKLLCLCVIIVSAQLLPVKAADTLFVKGHDKVHLGGYGDYVNKTAFPSGNNKYRKVYLDLTLGCPTGGCSQWDYTVQVFARNKPGYNDTLAKKAPNYRVNGNIEDSTAIAYAQTYTYFYNTTKQAADSTANSKLIIARYQNSGTPTVATDTLNAYRAGGYRYTYNGAGAKIDSTVIKRDTTLILAYYNYTEIVAHIDEFDIARLITPYAGNYAKTWTNKYHYDITDFAGILKDSVEIRVRYSGWSDGFTATCDYQFIKGTPERDVVKLQRMWTGDFPYGDPNNTIENYLKPTSINIPQNVKSLKLFVIQTGHGGGGNENCAEFCKKTHKIIVNQQTRYTTAVWRDNCGLNLLFPQAGTWIYDRANWCPGAQVTPYEYELGSFVTPGGNAQLDMDMQVFTNVSNSNTQYTIGSSLVYYGAPNFNNDAELLEIQSPTNNFDYNRSNPICNSSVIRIKNTGAQTLTTVDIDYGVVGGVMQKYTWTGSLTFLQTATVTLPILYGLGIGAGVKKFIATVSNPNGQQDANADNNTLLSSFVCPPTYPTELIIHCRTNNAGNETSYAIKNEQGVNVFSRSSLGSNKYYDDTLSLATGCYRLELKDAGKDGLYFFANQDGTGNFAIRKKDGTNIRTVNPDFGTSVIQYFNASNGAAGISAIAEEQHLLVYPNPAADMLNIETGGLGSGTKQLLLYNMLGQTVYTQTISGATETAQIDATGLVKGLYFVTLKVGDHTYREKVMIAK